MNKVYITNKSAHDFTKAQQFGELVFLTEGRISKYRTSEMYRITLEMLAGSTVDDYIVLTGLPAFISIISAIFAVKHKRLNLLIFNKEEEYEVRRIVMEGI